MHTSLSATKPHRKNPQLISNYPQTIVYLFQPGGYYFYPINTAVVQQWPIKNLVTIFLHEPFLGGFSWWLIKFQISTDLEFILLDPQVLVIFVGLKPIDNKFHSIVMDGVHQEKYCCSYRMVKLVTELNWLNISGISRLTSCVFISFRKDV